MTQATPGPWWINPYGATQILGQPPNPPVIATTLRWEDASLIARAVNERPELIAALETTIGNLMNVQIDLSTGGTKAKADKSLSEIITRAVAILEKAKAQ